MLSKSEIVTKKGNTLLLKFHRPTFLAYEIEIITEVNLIEDLTEASICCCLLFSSIVVVWEKHQCNSQKGTHPIKLLCS